MDSGASLGLLCPLNTTYAPAAVRATRHVTITKTGQMVLIPVLFEEPLSSEWAPLFPSSSSVGNDSKAGQEDDEDTSVEGTEDGTEVSTGMGWYV